MNRIYSFVLLPFLFTTLNIDCVSDFDCKPISNVSKTDYSLELKLKEGSSDDYVFELYDLNTGNLISKKTVFFQSGESKVVFEKVKPSAYTIYFSSSNCSKKKSVKGKGIVLQ